MTSDAYITTAEAARLLGYRNRRGLLKAVERGELVPCGMRGRTFLFQRSTLVDALALRASHQLRARASRAPEQRCDGTKERGRGPAAPPRRLETKKDTYVVRAQPLDL